MYAITHGVDHACGIDHFWCTPPLVPRLMEWVNPISCCCNISGRSENFSIGIKNFWRGSYGNKNFVGEDSKAAGILEV